MKEIRIKDAIIGLGKDKDPLFGSVQYERPAKANTIVTVQTDNKTVQIPLNSNDSQSIKFNGANIEPQGGIHAFSYNSIFSFSVKISDFTNSSYKHQYVEWEKTA